MTAMIHKNSLIQSVIGLIQSQRCVTAWYDKVIHDSHKRLLRDTAMHRLKVGTGHLPALVRCVRWVRIPALFAMTSLGCHGAPRV